MSDYISRESVLKILSYKNAAWDAYSKVSALPAADVREVVRCKYCKHRFNYGGLCEQKGDNWFCAYGERPNCGARMSE